MEYQTANLPMIEQVVKLERDPKAKMSPAQQAVKTAWDKWREESTTFTRAVSAARIAVVAATGPAAASLTQPGQPAFDPSAFQGEMVTKDVVARRPGAQSAGPDRARDDDPDDDPRRRHDGRPAARRTVDHYEDRRRVITSAGLLLGTGDQGSGTRRYASSSLAYLARSVFWPTEAKRTTTLTSSSSSSIDTTVPTPNIGWRTLPPARRPPRPV